MLAELLDALWPRPCEVCGRPADRPGRHVCADCLNRLPFLPTDGCCRRCGRYAPGLDGEFLCEDCRATRPHFDRAASVLRFEGCAREMVNAFKFRNHLWLRADFVDWLEAVARTRFRVDQIDVVLPMPATLAHRLDRGYNQCAYLARPLAKRLGLPFDARALRRIGSPRRQGGLDEEDRRENVIGTFATRRSLSGRGRAKTGPTVLLVDDIMTTGSTLSECARTLKDAGAGRVWCLALAHSIRA